MASKEWLEKRNEYLEEKNDLLAAAIIEHKNATICYKEIESLYRELDEATAKHLKWLIEQEKVKQDKVNHFHAKMLKSAERYEGVCKLLLPIVRDMIDSDGETIINFADGYKIVCSNPKDDSGQSDYDVQLESGRLSGIRQKTSKIIIDPHIEDYPEFLDYPLWELLVISDIKTKLREHIEK